MFYVPTGVVQLREVAAPSTPAAGQHVLYPKSDHRLYTLGSDAVERVLDTPVDRGDFTQTGQLVVRTYTQRWYSEYAGTLLVVRASVATAPTGASIIIDLLKNGLTTYFTGGTGRPTITAGTNTATGTPVVTAVAAGDYITLSVSQVGSTVPGSDLVVSLRVARI